MLFARSGSQRDFTAEQHTPTRTERFESTRPRKQRAHCQQAAEIRSASGLFAVIMVTMIVNAMVVGAVIVVAMFLTILWRLRRRARR